MLPSVSYYLARLKVDDEACAVIGLHLVQNMMRLHNMIRLHISHIPMVCLKKKNLFLHLLSTRQCLDWQSTMMKASPMPRICWSHFSATCILCICQLFVIYWNDLTTCQLSKEFGPYVNCQLFLCLDMSEVIVNYWPTIWGMHQQNKHTNPSAFVASHVREKMQWIMQSDWGPQWKRW